MKMAKKTLGTSFSERVVQIALSVPKGRVTTYGRIARAAGGGAMTSQSVTNILGKAYNNGQTDIPFHRIVYADGSVWMNNIYRTKRLKLYKEEGIEIDGKGKIKNFEEKLWEFK